MPLPATIRTLTTIKSVRFHYQRKLFFAATRFWLFYFNGTNLVYETSLDGFTWSGATTIAAADGGQRLSVHFDGTYVHYAREYGGDLMYRRGTPNSDGTITWSAAEQTAFDADTTYGCYGPYVAVDSDGYPWIGFMRRTVATSEDYPFVTKSSKNDGTWTTDAGFPYQLSTTDGAFNWRVVILALTGGKMYALYCMGNETMLGQEYDGGWGAEESVTTSKVRFGHHSAVAEDDDVHVVFSKYIPAPDRRDIRYVKRDSVTGWGSEVVLLDEDPNDIVTPNITIYEVAEEATRLYVFWLDNDGTMYFRVNEGGEWSSQYTWFTGEDQPSDYEGNLTSFYTDYDDKIGLVWITGASSPYSLRFSVINLMRGVLKTAPSSL